MNHFENGRQKALNAIIKKQPNFKYGFDASTAAGQKRLMDYSMGRDTESHITRSIPLGNGKFKMVPSGDIVDFEERNKRLKK